MPSELGFIWPKDPRRGNPPRWSRLWRLKDVFTNRGPDIFVGRIDKTAPDETDWSLWRRREDPRAGKGDGKGICTKASPGASAGAGAACSGSSGYYCDGDGKDEKGSKDEPFALARRSPKVRYDFRRRKYLVPDAGTWSKVQYCRDEGHGVPLQFWDQDGVVHPAGRWHDLVYRNSDCEC